MVSFLLLSSISRLSVFLFLVSAFANLVLSLYCSIIIFHESLFNVLPSASIGREINIEVIYLWTTWFWYKLFRFSCFETTALSNKKYLNVVNVSKHCLLNYSGIYTICMQEEVVNPQEFTYSVNKVNRVNLIRSCIRSTSLASAIQYIKVRQLKWRHGSIN